MSNKRGLSSVVTTIILILLVIAAIAGVWVAVNNLLIEGSSKIEFGGLTLDLAISNASINYQTGIATVQVTRNTGGNDEEIVAIKFIVEDTKSGEVYEEETINFVELSSRTFELNLSNSEILNLAEVHKISIAAVYVTDIGAGGGTPTTGGISDSVENLNEGFEGQGLFQIVNCEAASDCGEDVWIENTRTCNGDNTAVNQYKTIFSCVLGFCQNSADPYPREICIEGSFCYEGQCIPESNPCTDETVERDCGTDGFVGFPVCASNPESIIQDYRTYSCVEGFCSTSSLSQTIEECLGGEVCAQAECFMPLECTKNSDCPLGEVCDEGTCVTERLVISGSVLSSWPFGVGEYFDSVDLPQIPEVNYNGYIVIFPSSLETRCLSITSFVASPEEGANSYIRLNYSETDVVADDYFEIWETSYGCTLI